ncbi:MAG: response regulator [Acidobacteria bacterium]|nr:response regulator [Acidobacteriota bacterium]
MDESAPLVLVVEDEPQLRRFLRTALGSHGYRVEEAVDGAQGMRLATSLHPDVILLDLGLPDLDGLEVGRRIREWSQVPIIVVSARGREEDKVKALDLGVDDYLTKPFGTGELLARIRVALRHARGSGPDQEAPLRWGDVEIDPASREVRRGGSPVHLTPNEFKLLAVMARHAGKVLTHPQLLREVWGGVAAAQPHYLRVYMAQLRHKLETDPARPKHLLTELGVGYRLKVD